MDNNKKAVAPEVPIQEQPNDNQFEELLNKSGKMILTRSIPFIIGPLENQ